MKRKGDRIYLITVIMIVILLHQTRVEGACTYTPFDKKTGSRSEATLVQGAKTLDACKEACDTKLIKDSLPCVAMEMQQGFCFLYSSPQDLVSGEGVYYSRTCVPDKCTMTARQENTVGSSSSVIMTSMSSAETCAAACRVFSNCEAVTYVADACKMFDKVEPANETDAVDYYKINCSDGSRCCMTKASDKKASGAAVVVFTQNAESCEQACLMYDNCQAVHFFDNVCNFHLSTATPNIGQGTTGSTFSEKNCTDNAVDGNFTINEQCAVSNAENSKNIKDKVIYIFVVLVMILSTH